MRRDGFAFGVLAPQSLGQHGIEGAGLSLQFSADDREIDVVDEHPAFRQSRVVTIVDLAAERVVEGRVDARLDLLPDNVSGEREAGIGERSHDVVPREQSRVDFAHVGGLEGIAFELEDGHHQPVTRLDDVVIDVSRVGM